MHSRIMMKIEALLIRMSMERCGSADVSLSAPTATYPFTLAWFNDADPNEVYVSERAIQPKSLTLLHESLRVGEGVLRVL